MGFEAVEQIELRSQPGSPIQEQRLGEFHSEDDAIAAGRVARETFLASGRNDYAWWIVRVPGQTLARWIADSSSDKEFVLDLRTGELVEY